MVHLINNLVEKAAFRFVSQPKVIKAIKRSKITPDITISRDPGSGGKLVAKLVAKRLGWKLLDKKILSALSDELGIPKQEFAEVDEHSRGWLADSIHSLINPNYVNDLHYIAHLKKLLITASEKEDVVILGRGANHILPPERVLRVRITASFSKRVKNTVKHERKTQIDAEEWVRHVESKRVKFVQQYFGVNPYNPWHYDLVVNTDTLTLQQAAEIVVQSYLVKFPSERRRLANQLKK